MEGYANNTKVWLAARGREATQSECGLIRLFSLTGSIMRQDQNEEECS